MSQQDGAGPSDDLPIVVGQQVRAPAVGAVVSDPQAFAVSTAQPSPYITPHMSGTGTWTVPGCGTSGGSNSSSGRRVPGSGGGYGGVAAGDDGAPSMTHTGTRRVPGCGTASAAGGRRFEGEKGSSSQDLLRRSSSSGKQASGGAFGGVLAIDDDSYVADGGPVLVACGQGRSMYNVRGCLSSWVLAGGGGGRPRQGSAVAEKYGSAAGGSGGGMVADGGYTREPGPGSGSWALRSEDTPAGDGGIMCSACVPSVASGQGMVPRMLVTGGKDSMLREWEVADGRPRVVAELAGHTDWISCCALMPSTTAGFPPSLAISGGRDGSVKFWSKSFAATAPSAAALNEKSMSGKGTYASSRNGSYEGYGTGGGGGTGGAGWSLASCMPGAHGSSEFVTCCACPGGASGATAGWVATGGTDWAVRLWDVEKSRELGRLSFKGHNHPVRSVSASSDGNLLVSGGEDHKVVIWSPQSRRALATLKGHASSVNGVAIDPGMQSGQPPRWVASGGGEGFLFVWDPRNWESPVATLRGDTPVGSSSSLGGSDLSGATLENGGSLRTGSEAKLRGEHGRWEGETTGATMLNSVNCLAAGGAGSGGDWLFGGGETVVRAWQRKDGMWVGGVELHGEGLGGVASISVVE